MWLSDFSYAITVMMEVFDNSCWKSIAADPFGNFFLFVSSNDNRYKYFPNSGAIIEIFDDTWRTGHTKVIREPQF